MASAPDTIRDGGFPPSTVADFRGENLEKRLKASHDVFSHVLIGHEKELLKPLSHSDESIPYITDAIHTMRYGHISIEGGWQFRDPMDRRRNKAAVDLISPYPGVAEVTVHAGKELSAEESAHLQNELLEFGSDEIAKFWAFNSTLWNPDSFYKILTAGVKQPRFGIHPDHGIQGLALKIPRAVNLVGLYSSKLRWPDVMDTNLDIPGSTFPDPVTVRRVQEVAGIGIIAGQTIGWRGNDEE